MIAVIVNNIRKIYIKISNILILAEKKINFALEIKKSILIISKRISVYLSVPKDLANR